MRGSYYNEIDPFAAEMLRNLIYACSARGWRIECMKRENLCEHAIG